MNQNDSNKDTHSKGSFGRSGFFDLSVSINTWPQLPPPKPHPAPCGHGRAGHPHAIGQHPTCSLRDLWPRASCAGDKRRGGRRTCANMHRWTEHTRAGASDWRCACEQSLWGGGLWRRLSFQAPQARYQLKCFAIASLARNFHLEASDHLIILAGHISREDFAAGNQSQKILSKAHQGPFHQAHTLSGMFFV